MLNIFVDVYFEDRLHVRLAFGRTSVERKALGCGSVFIIALPVFWA